MSKPIVKSFLPKTLHTGCIEVPFQIRGSGFKEHHYPEFVGPPALINEWAVWSENKILGRLVVDPRFADESVVLVSEVLEWPVDPRMIRIAEK